MVCLLRYASLFIPLDACCLRYCLFPEPLLKSLKFLNSPSAQTARIFTRLSQWFFTGNNQRLNNRHLRSDELFSESRHLALLPFRSSGVLFKVFPAPGGSWFLDFFGQVKGHGKYSFGAQAS